MGFHIGQKVKGKVTGVQPYGIFVQLDSTTQGLVHISEVTHGFVDNIKQSYEVGEEVEVLVLDVDEYSKQISLSIRALEKIQLKQSKHRKYHPRYSNFDYDAGFRTIEEKLDQWIDDSLKDLKDYKAKQE